MVVDARPAFHLGFDADDSVGLGIRGDVLLAEYFSPTLHKYQMEAGTYTHVWQRELPEGMDKGCRKELTASGHLLLQQWDDDGGDHPTVILGPDGSQIGHRLQPHKGRLIGLAPPASAMYAVWREAGRGEGGWEVAVVSEDGRESRFRPEAGREWGELLSVCRDSEDRMAVVDSSYGSTSTLDIFSHQQSESYTIQHS